MSKTTKTTKATKSAKTTAKTKQLVIVESPTKAKTLSKILGKDYIIDASMGHIRDLPKKGLGVDVEHDFTPEYEIPTKAKKTVTKLKKALTDVSNVVLATDLDREGEAIAWHLRHILSSTKKGKDLTFSRVVFHELTKDAVLEAFSHPTTLNENLVDSQQARRVLDRLVGYKLSPLLWKKVRYGLSAGRVQSAGVRLVVEKERERDAFNPEEYWSILVDFAPQDATNKPDKSRLFTTSLEKKDGKKLELKNETQTKKAEKDLKDDTFEISKIKKSQRSKKPNAPFKTSTLQQTMANTSGFAARRTMSAAQKLFEHGLITYHRTDAITLSPQFVDTARAHIKKSFGAEYLPKEVPTYKTKSKGAQEAHEAIRPTDLSINTSSSKLQALEEDAQKTYIVILKRALESQMMPAVYDQTTVLVESSKKYELKATGSIITFDGWLAVGKSLGVFSEKENLKVLPELTEGEAVEQQKIETKQHFTQPPARYSDASLIKKLEELGIGRPSTYAPTLSTIQRRGYVVKEGRYYMPTDVAYVVTDLLVEHFPNVTDYEFTAQMENKFDEIAAGNTKWVPIIRDFYTPFEKTVEEKDETLSKHDITNLGETDEKCPDCGSTIVIKLGKYGKFLSCSNYPDCKYAKPMENDVVKDEDGNEITDFGKCEKCDDGAFILKQGRFGKFLACSNYPKCKTTQTYLDKIGMKCPECEDGEVVRKKAKRGEFFGCSNYPDCKYASWKNPLENPSEA